MRWRALIFTYVDYVLYALPGLLVTLWANRLCRRAHAAGSSVTLGSCLAGAEVAAAVMRAGGVGQVEIEPVRGELSDYYDADRGILRLSPAVFGGTTLSAAGIAAHEAGHAIQKVAGYPGLAVCSSIVPLASISSTVCWLLVTAGLLIGMRRLVHLGIALFSLAVVLQVVNLPVEFDASRRAREVLRGTGLVGVEEEVILGQVMNAAAWSYVACASTGVSALAYYLGR